MTSNDYATLLKVMFGHVAAIKQKRKEAGLPSAEDMGNEVLAKLPSASVNRQALDVHTTKWYL